MSHPSLPLFHTSANFNITVLHAIQIKSLLVSVSSLHPWHQHHLLRWPFPNASEASYNEAVDLCFWSLLQYPARCAAIVVTVQSVSQSVWIKGLSASRSTYTHTLSPHRHQSHAGLARWMNEQQRHASNQPRWGSHLIGYRSPVTGILCCGTGTVRTRVPVIAGVQESLSVWSTIKSLFNSPTAASNKWGKREEDNLWILQCKLV